MADTINFYAAITEQDASGNPIPVPDWDLREPIKPVSVTGDFRKVASITLAKSATRPTLLWSSTENQKFEAIALKLLNQSGYVRLAWEVNKPVSDTDLTADGTTHRRINQADLSCFAPFVLSSDEAPVHPTIATGAGVDANGEPAILTSGTTVSGRVYKLWAINTSTTADAEIAVYIKN